MALILNKFASSIVVYMLDVTRLRVLVAVATHGSVTAAARELNYAQPSVSHHLARLEAETGVRLIQRAGRGIRLTDAGRLLAERAAEVLGRLDAAENELAAHAGLSAGRVRLAAFPSALGTIVPAAASMLRAEYAGMDVRLTEAEPLEALRMLRAGHVDIALIFRHAQGPPQAAGPAGPEENGTRGRLLLDEPVHLITRAPGSADGGHLPGPEAAALHHPADLARYAGRRWIAGCDRCRVNLITQCSLAGFTPKIAFTTDDYVAVQALVAAGLGVAMLPGLALCAARHPGIRAVALPGARRHVFAVQYGEPPDSPAVTRLIDALAAAAGALAAAPAAGEPGAAEPARAWETVAPLSRPRPLPAARVTEQVSAGARSRRPVAGQSAVVWSDGRMAATTRHTGRWTLEDRFASPWHYLPLEVPRGTGELRVTLRYDRAAGVLDLGCLGPGGFRGWSGGARNGYVIAAGEATPGYLPGEIEPGLWQAIVGLHRLPPGGLPYELTAQVIRSPGALFGPPPSPPVPARPPRRDLPAGAGRRWRAGDLHTHTVHSDGALTVDELARFAAASGLDFIAVTDHNTVSHHRELPGAARRYGITLIPGQEVTTSDGHANALGDVGWVDFRAPAAEWLTATRGRGGLLSVNHPIAGPVSWMHAMPERPPLVEVWHWSWLDLSWTTPLSWWRAFHPGAIPVGGSVWHRTGSDAPPGTPTTWVESGSDDPADLLASIAAGRVAISAQRNGPVLLRTGGEIVAVGADGTTLAGPDGPRARIRGDRARFPGTPGSHRLLSDAGATMALTP